MITITCTNCQTSLTMDEAFAGGVCRCQHCGTIQTVPKSARDQGGVSSGVLPQATQKALWKQKSTSEGIPGTGLDDLADIVASSGLAGSGLQSRGLRKSAPPAKPGNKKLIPILAGAGVAIVLLLGVVIWLLLGQGDGDGVAAGGSPNVVVSNSGKTINLSGPNFAGVKLNGAKTVTFVLDRGSGTQSVFGDLKNITLKSIKSLGSDRKFQVVFWDVRGNVIAYPEDAATVAGDLSLGEAIRKLDEVAAFGSSSVGPALKKAAAAKPDVIVLATGKGGDLSEEFLSDVNNARPAGAKIHAFSLGSSGQSEVLRKLAQSAGGEYHHLADSDLSAMAQQ